MSCASFFAAIAAGLMSVVASSFAFCTDFLLALSIERRTESYNTSSAFDDDLLPIPAVLYEQMKWQLILRQPRTQHA